VNDGSSGSPLLTAAQRAFVLTRRVAHLATGGADGAPHAVPVCFALDGANVYIAVDEKPKRGDPRGLRRLRNIAANPRAALVADRYDDDWSRLGYVLLRGRAEVIDGGDEHAAALRLLRERYAPYRYMALESLPVIALRIERAVSWGRLDE